MKKFLSILLAVTFLISSLIGCATPAKESSSASNSSAENTAATGEAKDTATAVNTQSGDRYTIGVIIHTTTDFLCSRLKAYTDYISENFPVDFNFYIIENFADETYLAGIENLCSQGVDGIIATNFSGTAVLQGLKTCEESGVYLGIGFSQVDEAIKDQVYASDYFVGGSFEDDYNAGYDLIESLIDTGCTNIAAIGYEPGITCHDRRWDGMMQAFEDHPEIKKAGEYRGLEFSKAVEDFLASDETIDGIAITLLGMEYCAEPIKSAGREGKVKIACCDFSDNSLQGLESGQLACTVGGQYVDVVFPFVLLYNALTGTPLSEDKTEVHVNFITCKTAAEFQDYMTYLHGDTFCWTADELKQVLKAYNPDASAEDLVKMGSDFSVEDTIARHGK